METLLNIRRNDYRESGLLFTYRISNFKLLPQKEGVNFRGICNLDITVEGKGSMTYSGVSLSPIMVKRLVSNPDWYLNKDFTGYNTSMFKHDIPFKFMILNDSEYILFAVEEKKGINIEVNTPLGKEVKLQNQYYKPGEYIRFLRVNKKSA